MRNLKIEKSAFSTLVLEFWPQSNHIFCCPGFQKVKNWPTLPLCSHCYLLSSYLHTSILLSSTLITTILSVILLAAILLSSILLRLFFKAPFGLFWPLHGPFTVPYGPKFFTAPNIFLRPLLRKRAVATATWQPCTGGRWIIRRPGKVQNQQAGVPAGSRISHV